MGEGLGSFLAAIIDKTKKNPQVAFSSYIKLCVSIKDIIELEDDLINDVDISEWEDEYDVIDEMLDTIDIIYDIYREIEGCLTKRQRSVVANDIEMLRQLLSQFNPLARSAYFVNRYGYVGKNVTLSYTQRLKAVNMLSSMVTVVQNFRKIVAERIDQLHIS